MKSLTESILDSTGSGKKAVGIGEFKIGTIISAPYTYSARHNYFYQIVSVKGKATIIVRELEKQNVTDDGYGQNGTEKPIPNKFVSGYPEIKARINKRGHLVVRGCNAHIWDGAAEPYYTD